MEYSLLYYLQYLLYRNELTCDICIDIITDIDEWLTSDKTEQEIVDFVSQVRGSCKWLARSPAASYGPRFDSRR